MESLFNKLAGRRLAIFLLELYRTGILLHWYVTSSLKMFYTRLK